MHAAIQQHRDVGNMWGWGGGGGGGVIYGACCSTHASQDGTTSAQSQNACCFLCMKQNVAFCFRLHPANDSYICCLTAVYACLRKWGMFPWRPHGHLRHWITSWNYSLVNIASGHYCYHGSCGYRSLPDYYHARFLHCPPYVKKEACLNRHQKDEPAWPGKNPGPAMFYT